MKITSRWILTKFRKLRGDNLDTREWEELSAGAQLQLLDGINLAENEVPVVAFTPPPNRIVVTTKRIIWRSDGPPRELPVTSISSVKSPEYMHKEKLKLSKVVITTRSGEEYTLATAPGKTLFILWNLLLMFTRVTPESERSQST